MRALAAVLLLAAPLLAGRAVLRDGDIVEGEVELSLEEQSVKLGRKTLPLREIRLLEDDDGRLVWAPDFRTRLLGYECLARERACALFARLTREAVRLGSPALARDLFAKSVQAGLSDKDEKRLEKEVGKAKEKSPPQAERDRIEKEAAGARDFLAEILAERAAVALATPETHEDGLRVLREALVLAPTLPAASTLLAQEAPASFGLGDARFWLDFHLDIEALGVQPAPEDELELNRARAHWRPDLYGLVSPPILLITPVRDTRVVGRCLACGRLACETLARLFATDHAMKRHESPLTILLYTDKPEYEKYSGSYSHFEDRGFLTWSAGHYSPLEQVSRFFWLKDRDAERRIVGTCVHELTHHWIQEQNPRYASSQMHRQGGQPGHWIVEGFASFMEEGRYSLENGTADLFNPRSTSLDVVQALAGSGRLIDWKRLYAITGKDFQALSGEKTTPVVRRWSLWKSKYSERSLFYEQSAATCAYLFHAEGGKYRDRLLDFVVAYYTGDQEGLDPEKAFGMTPQQLGDAVVQFARGVAAGWKPEEEPQPHD